MSTKILSASGIEELDHELKEKLPVHGMEIVGTCYHRNVLEKVAKEVCADTVILSPALAGEKGFLEIVYTLRMAGLRVVILPGNQQLESTQTLVKQVIPFGIYDFIYDRVRLEDIINKLLKPGSMGDLPPEFTRAAVEDGMALVKMEKSPPENTKGGSGIKERLRSISRAFGGLSGSKECVGQSLPDADSLTPELIKTTLPEGFLIWGNVPGQKCYTKIEEIRAANPAAVLVFSLGPDYLKRIKELRREYSFLSVPMVVVGECDAMDCHKAGADECVPVLDEKALAGIMARAEKYKVLREKTGRDDLTGLYKRNFLNEYLSEQERRYKDTGVPFSLLLADLDHFKGVNDTYGHQAGDDVLKKFAIFLQEGVRKVDVVARYGGEEFVVVFPGTGIKEALPVVERLGQLWEKQKILLPSGEKIKSTISAGLAAMGKDVDNWEALIEAADGALYRAKRTGRNKVLAASAPGLRKPGEPRSIDFKSNFIILTGYAPREVVELAGLIKGRLAVIDADVENANIASAFGIDPEAVWQSDWRAGPTAEPFKINRNLKYYGLDHEVKNFEKRDLDILSDLIIGLRKSGQKVLINTGENKEIFRLVNSLKEEEINNGLYLRV